MVIPHSTLGAKSFNPVCDFHVHVSSSHMWVSFFLFFFTVSMSVGLQKDACEHSTTLMACQPPASHNLTSEPRPYNNAISVRQL